MPPASESLVGVVVRVESLEDQTHSLREDAKSTRGSLAELQTQIALLTNATERLTEALKGLQEDQQQETKERLQRSAMPTRAAWLLLAGALVTGALGGWIGRQLPDIPKAQVAQASTIGARP